MIRRLIILLLIVGCGSDSPTENTDSYDPQLVGAWEMIVRTTIVNGNETIINSNDDNNEITIMDEDGTYIFNLDKDVIEHFPKGNWWTIDNKIIIQDMDPIYNQEEMIFSINNGILKLNFCTKHDIHDNHPGKHLEIYLNKTTNPSS